jgi:hypothetical protein
MSKTKLLAIVALVIVSLSIAGCTSYTAPQATPTVAAASSVQPTPTATPTTQPTAAPTQTPATPQLATSINAWVPPVWYAEGLLPVPGVQDAVVQGHPATVAAIVNAADGTHPCGPAFSYYIDHQAAGGVWVIPENYGQGCGAGVLPHAELQLSGNDTAKLSVGTHMFQVSYPGDGTYAPAEYVTEFNVVA